MPGSGSRSSRPSRRRTAASVSARSGPDGGATFAIAIPLAPRRLGGDSRRSPSRAATVGDERLDEDARPSSQRRLVGEGGPRPSLSFYGRAGRVLRLTGPRRRRSDPPQDALVPCLETPDERTRTMTRPLTRIAALVAALALAASAGAATYAALDDPAAVSRDGVAAGSPVASSTALSVAEIYERAHSSVVEITVSGAAQTDPFGAPGGTAEAQGSGFVYDERGPHRHERPRRRRRRERRGAVLERRDPRGDRCRHGRLDRPRGARRGRRRIAARATRARGLVRRRSRRSGRRDREPVRPRGHRDHGHRERPRPLDGGTERLHDQRFDPDGRGDQPRQLRRAAARPPGPRDRRERADRERVGRERRRRLRDPRRAPSRRSSRSSSTTVPSSTPTSASR